MANEVWLSKGLDASLPGKSDAGEAQTHITVLHTKHTMCLNV
jgi:hypothetical protein